MLCLDLKGKKKVGRKDSLIHFYGLFLLFYRKCKWLLLVLFLLQAVPFIYEIDFPLLF